MNGMFVEKNGKVTLDGGGHYGMDQLGDNTFGYQCHYSTSYCSSTLNKIQRKGTGAIYDQRQVTSSSSVVTSNTVSLTRSISDITVAALVRFVPTNTSIELEVSNDGGTTWKSGIFSQKLSFSTPAQALSGKHTLMEHLQKLGSRFR